MTARRRVPGLRREEVAELVGVTPKWYTTFENSSSERHFSSAFVQRVADALRLDQNERAQLSSPCAPRNSACRRAVRAQRPRQRPAGALENPVARAAGRRRRKFRRGGLSRGRSGWMFFAPTSTAVADLVDRVRKSPRLDRCAKIPRAGRKGRVLRVRRADSPSASEARAVAERTLLDGPFQRPRSEHEP